PLKSDLKTASSGLTLSVSYYNEDGQPINPSNLRQGTSFWARYQVGQENARIDIEEVALLQVLPSGWEIENTRLANQELPGWMSSWPTGREEYLDIRDDRIMWFFDMPRHQRGLEFVVKLNAVTQGEYDLPGTLVEAMYSNEFEATVAGSRVTVSAK
ncbi:MAG TPA: hypothetical protein PKV71_20535, partial [Calditrichia bacterium]|nr:hypothetical protein [Calditrichia bacterium]